MVPTPHRIRVDRAIDALQQIPDPLGRVDAVRISRERLDALEDAAVRDARAAGITWKQIGALYGLSKQGAQQRFRAIPSSTSAEETHQSEQADAPPSTE